MAKILAIDDDPDILLTVRTTFESGGHEVVTTTEPRDFMGLPAGQDPDAIVLDVRMPEISGWELLAVIRQNPDLRSVPVLMLTALDDASFRVKGLRQGADDYLGKPFHPDELLIRVEKLVERHARSRVQGPTPCLGDAIASLERRMRQGQDLGEVQLGRYQVKDLLGEGAMGTVFRAWDPTLERPVALKTLCFGEMQVEREAQVARLLREAVTGARFNHPNIVTVYDVVGEGNAAVIAMELIDGLTLERLLGQQPLDPCEVIPLAAAIARGLAAAHEHDLIHRDIKPANVLLGNDDSIKITDFGVSALVSEAARLRSTFGTPGYLAPECLEGEKATQKTDLFALGVLLFECFTGAHPFFGHRGAAILHNTMTVDPPTLAAARPGVPPRAGEMVDRLMAKDPERRPASAAEVADLFEQLCDVHGWSWSYQATRETLASGFRNRPDLCRSPAVTPDELSLQRFAA